MTWNPLKRQSTPKVEAGHLTAATSSEETEVSNLVTRLNKLTDTSKLLYKDGKKYTESMHEVSKCENQFTHELSMSPICHHSDELRVLMEEYHSVTSQSQELCNDLILILRKALVEPMKKYNQMAIATQMTINKRDQAIQECQKHQAKVEKLKGKEKTGPNVAKRAMSEKALAASRREVAEHDTTLMVELPRILQARFEYFQPCLEALIIAKVSYCERFTALLNDLVKCQIVTKNQKDEASRGFETSVQRQLAEIRALSIVADD